MKWHVFLIILLLVPLASAETISSTSYKTTINIVSSDLISSTSYKSNPKIVPVGGLMSSTSYKTAINELSIPQAEEGLDTGSGGGTQGGDTGCPPGFKREGMECKEMTPSEYIIDTVEDKIPKAKPIVFFGGLILGFLFLAIWFTSDEEKKKKWKEKIKIHKSDVREELKEELKEQRERIKLD